MTPLTTVYDIAQTLLDTVINIYADNSVSLPPRQYINDGGQVAFDCELVSVSLARTYRGTANFTAIEPLRPQRCVGIRSADFRIWIVRCVSSPHDDGSPPTAVEITGYSLPLLTDAWLLPYGLMTAAAEGELLLPCDNILVGDYLMGEQQGAFCGGMLTVTYQLGDG